MQKNLLLLNIEKMISEIHNWKSIHRSFRYFSGLFKLILLLIIYCANFQSAFSQDLNLSITGKDSLETFAIHEIGYKKAHENFASISLQLDSLKNTLLKKGYIETKIESTTKVSDTLFKSEFSLGTKYDSIKVTFDNENDIFSILKTINHIKVNKNSFTTSFENIETTLQQINKKRSESGDPFSTLKLGHISIDNKIITAKLETSIKETQRTIDDIVIKGYEKFPKGYLKHYLKLKQGNTFNLTKINKQIEALNQLRFASQIKPPEALFTKDSTILYIYVEKTRSNNFDGFLGFSTNENTGNLEFNGYLNLALNNNLNAGETFTIIYKSNQSEQRTFDAQLKLPYLFSSPIGLELQLNLFKKDSSFTTDKQTAKAIYQISSKNELSGGISSIKSNNLLNDTFTTTNISDYDSFFYNFNYIYQNINIKSKLFPIKTLATIEYGNGFRKSQNTTEQQHLLYIDIFNNFNLNKKNSIYLRVNSGYLISDSYLENELFRFGGINSIRGFQENSLEAHLYSILNTEYRYLLSNSIYIHSIIDFSYLENNLTNQKENLYGFGLGFGLLTRAGLLKFNYTNGKNESQNFKLSNSQVHLSLTAFF